MLFVQNHFPIDKQTFFLMLVPFVWFGLVVCVCWFWTSLLFRLYIIDIMFMSSCWLTKNKPLPHLTPCHFSFELGNRFSKHTLYINYMNDAAITIGPTTKENEREKKRSKKKIPLEVFVHVICRNTHCLLPTHIISMYFSGGRQVIPRYNNCIFGKI